MITSKASKIFSDDPLYSIVGSSMKMRRRAPRCLQKIHCHLSCKWSLRLHNARKLGWAYQCDAKLTEAQCEIGFDGAGQARCKTNGRKLTFSWGYIILQEFFPSFVTRIVTFARCGWKAVLTDWSDVNMGGSKFFSLMGVEPTGFDPEHRFVTSWLLPPLGLAIYRLLFALFGWTNFIANWVWNGLYDPGDIGSEWSYFTTLTFAGLTVYMTVASIHTFMYWKKGYSLLDRCPRWIQALHSLFYSTIIVYPFIVTIVYWGLLYSSPWFPVAMDAYRNVSMSRSIVDELTICRLQDTDSIPLWRYSRSSFPWRTRLHGYTSYFSSLSLGRI